VGSVIALVGWYLRRRIPESPAFERLQREGVVSSSPIRELLSSHRAPLLQVFGLVLLHGVAFYIFYVFLPSYLTKVTDLPMGTALLLNTICMALLAMMIPFMGKLSDRVGHRWVLAAGAAGLALGTVPFFSWMSSGPLVLIVTAQVLITMFVSAYMGPFFAVVATLFPVARRYTGLSISYNMAPALFGGTAPLMATVMMERSGSTLAPGWYVSLCAVLSLAALSTIREEARRTVEVQAGPH